MNMNNKVLELVDFAVSRRGAVNSVGLGRSFAQGLSDLDILNFALTLEHLESRMYAEMVAKNILTGKDQSYITLFGQQEAAHVAALIDTIKKLGGTPVAAKATYNFPALANRGDILNLAKTAEDIGVGAYQGAAAAIKNKDVLAAAGSIVQVEARHAAIINRMIGLDPVVPAP